jgi:hypothetical protein
MSLGEYIGDDMRRVHAKVHEFIMQREADMNISLFQYFEFCTRGYCESWRF